MGIGGDLMWTALAYEIYKKHNKKVIFYKSNKIYKKLVFCNNPYIASLQNKNHIRIDIDFRIMPEMYSKILWKIENHTIYHRCKYYGYDNPLIKCHIFHTDYEKRRILNIVKNLPEHFIIIEPHAKKDWCAHKQYPLNKWQNIVNEISKFIPIVQMSVPSPENIILDDVINISNKIRNFREACFILKYSKLFISSEGGLMHGCNAVGGKSFIIYPPLFDPKWTKYEDTEYIWIKDDKHFNCFKTGFCKECYNIMNNHNENIIINKIKDILNL